MCIPTITLCRSERPRADAQTPPRELWRLHSRDATIFCDALLFDAALCYSGVARRRRNSRNPACFIDFVAILRLQLRLRRMTAPDGAGVALRDLEVWCGTGGSPESVATRFKQQQFCDYGVFDVLECVFVRNDRRGLRAGLRGVERSAATRNKRAGSRDGFGAGLRIKRGEICDPKFAQAETRKANARGSRSASWRTARFSKTTINPGSD